MLETLPKAIVIGLALASASAQADSVPLSQIFAPALTLNLASATPVARSSAEYKHFAKCETSLNPAVDCDPARPGYFFDLSQSLEVDDTFDLLNRCIGLRAGRPYAISPVQFDAVAKTAACVSPPKEIVFAHLLVCYEKVTGAFCSMGTICFEGAEARGKCTKNYEGNEIALSAN
jgi:hypothetical protein